MEIQIASLPIKYLGVPLSTNKLKSVEFEEPFDKINKKTDA